MTYKASMKNSSVLFFLLFVFQSLTCQTLQEWQESGVATLKGTVVNFEKYSKDFNNIEIQVNDWTNGYRRKCFAKIDQKGYFIASIFVFNKQEAFILYKNHVSTAIVRPNDTLTLLINADTFPDGINYQGETAAVSQITDNYYNKIQDSIFSISNSKLNFKLRDSLSFEKYKTWRDSVYQIEFKKSEIYLHQINDNPFYANLVRDGRQLRYFTELAGYKPWRMPLSDEVKMKCLISIVKSIDPDTTQKYFIINSNYLSLVNTLYSSVYLIGGYFELISRVNSPEKQTTLKPEKNAQIANSPHTSKQYVKDFYPYYVAASKLISNKKLRESVLAHFYTVTLEMQNVDLGLDTILLQISDERIKLSLINEFNTYKRRTSIQNSLKVNTTILDELKTRYKGYVLYIDFWSTWCPPCIEGLKYSTNLKKTFENKKVAFIYLCCNSDKSTWEKVFKEQKLDGENMLLNSEDYSQLAGEFNLIGVPRYIIVDKAGKVVNENAPRPSDNIKIQEILIKELNKYIDK